MRLIIKDYLLRLKEKDELDLLLCDLLLQMGFIVDNVPKTGNRQFGVDIQAHDDNELLLFVVKQNSIDRRMWDSDPNSVRQSINEIYDAYLGRLPENVLKEKIRIIVATNGTIDEAVRPTWDGFVNQHTKWQDIPLIIEFWGIDEITYFVEKHLFNEYLFPDEQQSRLRKALYFIEEGNYKRCYYEQIVDSYLSRAVETLQMNVSKRDREYTKCMSSLLLSIQMIACYAQNAGRNKIAIEVNEYLIIRYWKFMLESGLFEQEKYCKWLLMFCKQYEKANQQYYDTVQVFCEKPELFPKYYNGLERRFMLYEIIGFLTTYASYEMSYHPLVAKEITQTVIKLINDHEELPYVPIDGMIGIISIMFRLFAAQKRQEELARLLTYYIRTLIAWYRGCKKYPSAADSFRDALDIEMGNEHEGYEASGLWGYFLLWIHALGMAELYEETIDFLTNDLKEVTKCVWFLRPDEEALLYDAQAMQTGGEGLAVDLHPNYKDFCRKMDFIGHHYENDIFSYDAYSFPALEMIACRYYGYVPRVKINL